MSEGNKKQEKDFTEEVDALLPQTTALAQSGKLQDALDKLFALEKQSRNASDMKSTTRLVKAILELTYAARDYAQLNSSINVLSKKHGQLKAAIQAMVELAITWLDEIRERDGTEKWLELVETLRTVTEGKLFLETPRARVTLALAQHHESIYRKTGPSARDSLITSSDLLSDLQVETYSSMERKEKTEFILEQMRLLLEVARLKDSESGKDDKDSLGGGEPEWVKLRVQSRKVNEQNLKEKENEVRVSPRSAATYIEDVCQALRLKFYDMMVQYGLRHHSYLDVAKYYHKVWETPSIKEDPSGKGKIALEHIVYYVALAPHDNEQSDMMHRLYVDPALEKLEVQHNLIKSFITEELMRWPGIESVFGPFLRTTEVFQNDKHWEDLHTRVIEHNIRVIAKYYTRITLTRLTTLLDLTPQQAEETLSRLVVAGTVWARIDRPAGIVNFRNKRSAEDVMNDWSSDMQKLLGLVEKTWMGMNAAQAAQSRVKA
ncbi:PCI-domain-containing protein [Artomyces pyxidatus]|uniref:PCI-domain-containing protein n=1 Tax=Artomyces pyxidatus TaxID=48021 RepID=A0ACB8TDI2_9AGAM|nr:PCI-domain-containing protein [Artomyces pyxidatus]